MPGRSGHANPVVATLHHHLRGIARICDAALTPLKESPSKVVLAKVILAQVSAKWPQSAMINLNPRDRDEFLKALEEARRAAMAADGEPVAPPRRSAAAAPGSVELRQTIDRMAGKLRSYISAGLLARLYSDTPSRPPPTQAEPEPAPPKSEHEQVVDELHLTPNLTAADLKHLRRKFAKTNHPDRVAPPRRDQATRRMTIANSLIDEALQDKKAKAPT